MAQQRTSAISRNRRSYTDILTGPGPTSSLGPISAPPSAAPTFAAPAASSAMPAGTTPARARATGPYASVINDFADAQDRANQANETRYGDILNTLRDQGTTAKADVQRSGQAERGDITQDAISRGLYSTSVLDTLRNASREREGREMARIDETVANQRAGVMERRTDQGPNAGLYSQLLTSQASADQAGRRGTTTVGAMSGGGGGGGNMGFDPSMLGGSGRGGGGGSPMSGGPTFGRGGGGGGYTSSGVGTTRGSSSGVNPDGTARIDSSMVPRGGANVFLGERGSVTAGGQAPMNASSTIGASGSAGNIWDAAYWQSRGYQGQAAVEMAQRFASRRPR